MKNSLISGAAAAPTSSRWTPSITT
ncbi:hypothetical protein [Mesorhizobium sp.]